MQLMNLGTFLNERIFDYVKIPLLKVCVGLGHVEFKGGRVGGGGWAFKKNYCSFTWMLVFLQYPHKTCIDMMYHNHIIGGFEYMTMVHSVGSGSILLTRESALDGQTFIW